MKVRKIVRSAAPHIKRALKEDLPGKDITSNACVKASGQSVAVLVARRELVLAGLEIFREVMKTVDAGISVKFFATDGDKVKPESEIADIRGNSRSLLAAERTALNYLQRMSGIATLTARFVKEVRGTRAKILDTRKTTPNMRLLEKYAVTCGGGFNHRMDLTDAPLIKENHIRACGGITEAVRKVRKSAGKKKIILEVTNRTELLEGLNAGADILLLDNMTPAQVKKMVKLTAGRALLEVSGGVTLKNVRHYALAGVDRISVGALTHSAPAADLSLLFS